MKIFLILLAICPCLAGKAPSWEEYKKQTLSNLSSIEGWCSYEKADKMMNLIQEVKPRVCVEIGVFGGSSIYPTAKALSYQKQGVVYAIDPWSNQACLLGVDPLDPNYAWWEQVDLEKIYQGFLSMLRSYKLDPYCRVMRMPSTQAIAHFKDASIDILHVDGNHSEEASYSDVQLFFPKVKVGGYIWLDDVNWTTPDGKPTLEKAFSFLAKQCEIIDGVNDNNCLLLRRVH